MAAAVSNDYWYAWCSKRLSKDAFIYSLRGPNHTELIPMMSTSDSQPRDLDEMPRLVLGHNVSFDRSYMKEQYFIKEPSMKFLDTMSIHIAICGFTSMQRIMYMAKKKGKNMRAAMDEKKSSAPIKTGYLDLQWMNTGSMNSLDEVYQHHCDGQPLDKTSRNVFVKGNIEEVNSDFQNLLTYCANDVKATLLVFKKLWPQFRKHFPSPVTLAGMLEMSTAYLPVNTNWNRYIELSDQCFAANEDDIGSSLATIAADVCGKYAESFKSDPWLFDLDWSCPDMRLLKKKRKVEKGMNLPSNDSEHPVVKELLDTARYLPKRPAHMPGVPRWYGELFHRMDDKSWEQGPVNLTLQKRITPKLLKLKWDGYPLYHHEKHGWGYVVPDREELSQEEQQMLLFGSQPFFPYREAMEEAYNKPPSDQSIEGSIAYDGDFTSLINDSLERDSLTYAQSESIWSRIRGMSEQEKQVYFEKVSDEDGMRIPSWHSGIGPIKGVSIPGGWFYKLPHKDGEKYNVGNPLSKDYLPQIGIGLLTSAAGSEAIRVLRLNIQGSYWKNNRDRIRSQMVIWLDHKHLPPNVKQDDSYNPDGVYGAILPRIVTAGTVTRRAVEKTWLTASNAKADRIGSELKAMVQSPPGYHFVGADVDSQELWIASLLGDAYFAGIHGCTAIGWMTLQGTKAEGTDVHSKTASLIGINRDDAKVFNYGRIYGAGRMFAQKLLLQFNRTMTKEEAKSKANKMYQATKGTKKRASKFCDEKGSYRKAQWSGGSESDMFNALENTAVSSDPRTPALRCRITQPLQPQHAHEEFMTSRINWVVQSSAVDYLHLMLVSMKWLFKEFDIDGRFCISIHDEVRYLVKSEDRYRAALALHITNLYTRAFFAHKLGMNDLPQSVAFFSGVDLDKCLRKEATMDCKTPSNMHGMLGSCQIPPGETLDIYETLKITKGSLHRQTSS
ncbi:DNA polymerase subunit gamma-1-like [Watersipora subatra]|uniref:DNA polymerase subunit gamma-1-like n=1 Tax=Watersipora subatra TaxID=2589382 RepID=UPI00355BC796